MKKHYVDNVLAPSEYLKMKKEKKNSLHKRKKGR